MANSLTTLKHHYARSRVITSELNAKQITFDEALHKFNPEDPAIAVRSAWATLILGVFVAICHIALMASGEGTNKLFAIAGPGIMGIAILQLKSAHPLLFHMERGYKNRVIWFVGVSGIAVEVMVIVITGIVTLMAPIWIAAALLGLIAGKARKVK